jgi:hypothetical protein
MRLSLDLKKGIKCVHIQKLKKMCVHMTTDPLQHACQNGDLQTTEKRIFWNLVLKNEMIRKIKMEEPNQMEYNNTSNFYYVK